MDVGQNLTLFMVLFHQGHDQLWDGGGAGNRFQPERVLPLHAHGDAPGLRQPQDDAQWGEIRIGWQAIEIAQKYFCENSLDAGII